MDVAGTLFGDGRLMNKLIAPRRFVVMAKENAGFSGKRQDFLNGVVKGMGVAPWKIATGGPGIRRKECGMGFGNPRAR